MEFVFLAIEDPSLRDQVRAGLRMFPNLRPVNLPQDLLPIALRSEPMSGAIILDGDRSRGDLASRMEVVRELQPDLLLLVVGPRGQRERMHRSKLELEIFSHIPTPLEAFDLARRLNRLSLAFQSSDAGAQRSAG